MQRNENRSFFKPWMLLPLVLLAILGYLFLAQKGRSHAVNAYDPGAELEIEALLQKGKTNIVDFYSDYCPPCRKISPLLQELGRKRPDLAILAVDINRKGVKGIDWTRPWPGSSNCGPFPISRSTTATASCSRKGRKPGRMFSLF